MRFKERYPKIEVRLQFITHDSFPELLKKGEIDIAYTINPLIEDNSLLLLYKKPEKLGFYTAPSHPLAKKKKVTEEDLIGIPLLLTGHECSFRHMLISHLEDRKITCDIAIETGSKEVLKQFAAKGLGAAFIPDMAAEQEVKNGSLVKLNWAGADFPVYSQVFVHKDKHISKAIKGFCDMIALRCNSI